MFNQKSIAAKDFVRKRIGIIKSELKIKLPCDGTYLLLHIFPDDFVGEGKIDFTKLGQIVELEEDADMKNWMRPIGFEDETTIFKFLVTAYGLVRVPIVEEGEPCSSCESVLFDGVYESFYSGVGHYEHYVEEYLKIIFSKIGQAKVDAAVNIFEKLEMKRPYLLCASIHTREKDNSTMTQQKWTLNYVCLEIPKNASGFERNLRETRFMWERI